MKLMVLGGGNCQLNLIKRAKERGHFIILIDYLKNPVGRAFSDIHLRISTFDKGKILLAAIDNRIEGIITLGTDQPILVCAYIAMKLNLHFYIDELIALNVTNKRFMKQKFIDNHIPTVKYVLIKKDFSDKELDNISFPIILKPVDSQGQRGIFKLYSIDEIREKIDITLSYSRDNVVLIEEFYKNDEITVNGWIDNGHFTMISVVDRVTIKDKDSVGVCLCHNYPSIYLNKYYNEINRLTLKIIKSFNICNGPIYFQYLVGEDGIKVNEIAMRIGGAYEDITIPILSNIDILDLLLTYIEKGKIKNDQLMKYEAKSSNKFLSTQMFFCKKGKVKSITKKSIIEKLKGVLKVYYIIKENQILESIDNATARAGYILIEGNNFKNMIDNINCVFDKLQILDENNNNLVIKYSDYKDKYIFNKE